MTKTEILIIAALAEEADAIFPGEGIIEQHAHLRVRQLGPFRIAACGLGKVNAAQAVGCLAEPSTSAIFMGGTCGRIGAIKGDTFWISHAIQHDYGARHATGFTPYRAGEWPFGNPGEAAFAAMPDPGLALPIARIVSGDLFLACADSAAEIARHHNAHLVDMEVAAIAQAASNLGLPWAAIKAVTDGADGSGEADFAANLAIAARKSAASIEALVAIVQGGRPHTG